MPKHDGGPAFEQLEVEPGFRTYTYGGMKLRDWFAGQALIGTIVARSAAGLDVMQESIAEECYELADAMLEARQKAGDDD